MEKLLPIIFGSFLIFLFAKALFKFEDAWRTQACGPAGALITAAIVGVSASMLGYSITPVATTLVLFIAMMWILAINIMRDRALRDSVSS